MTPADQPLPPDTLLGLHPERPGPVQAGEFETWPQGAERPMELIAGWVVPMSPGDFLTGEVSADLAALLLPLVRGRGWRMSHDARHRLPRPADTVVFPDLAIHCAPEVEMVPGTRTVSRVPELVIELLGEETAERDMAPRGAKFLAYQMSGVREYFYAWPDGREAASFRRKGDLLVPIEPDDEGLLASELLAARLHLAPARLCP
ncbi:MAG TPA: Uma2 family endonuclease [Thermoanaerobaculia bacterium]|nr:Uma2 family endonuclease [Thermoanaerobaculia bacterium]